MEAGVTVLVQSMRPMVVWIMRNPKEVDETGRISDLRGRQVYSSVKNHVKRRITIKKSIWIAVGITGMLLGSAPDNAQAAVNVQISTGNRQSFVMDSRPSFIDLGDLGFSVSIGSPYDIIFYGNRYYLYNNSRWYRSSNYRGPWRVVQERYLPAKIRTHRWTEIRRYRDVEYSRRDQRFDWYKQDHNNMRNNVNNRDQLHDRNNRNNDDNNRNNDNNRQNNNGRKN